MRQPHEGVFFNWSESDDKERPCSRYHEGKEDKRSDRVLIDNHDRSPNNEDGEESERHDDRCFAEGEKGVKEEEKE